jgi:hypothetical protein
MIKAVNDRTSSCSIIHFEVKMGEFKAVYIDDK